MIANRGTVPPDIAHRTRRKTVAKRRLLQVQHAGRRTVIPVEVQLVAIPIVRRGIPVTIDANTSVHLVHGDGRARVVIGVLGPPHENGSRIQNVAGRRMLHERLRTTTIVARLLQKWTAHLRTLLRSQLT